MDNFDRTSEDKNAGRNPDHQETAHEQRPLGRRAMKQAQMRERLLAGARAVFARVGISEATIAQITSEANVGFGTFYLYFQTKEDAYQAALREGFAVLNAKLSTIISTQRDQQRPWEEMLCEAVTAYLQFAAENRDLYIVMLAGQQGGQLTNADIVLRSSVRIAALVHYIQQSRAGQPFTRLIDEGGFNTYPLNLLTVNVTAVLNRTAIWWLRNNTVNNESQEIQSKGDEQSPTLEEVSTLICQFLIGGFAHSLPQEKNT